MLKGLNLVPFRTSITFPKVKFVFSFFWNYQEGILTEDELREMLKIQQCFLVHSGTLL